MEQQPSNIIQKIHEMSEAIEQGKLPSTEQFSEAVERVTEEMTFVAVPHRHLTYTGPPVLKRTSRELDSKFSEALNAYWTRPSVCLKKRTQKTSCKTCSITRVWPLSNCKVSFTIHF
jgi:hypothetical protein